MRNESTRYPLKPINKYKIKLESSSVVENIKESVAIKLF